MNHTKSLVDMRADIRTRIEESNLTEVLDTVIGYNLYNSCNDDKELIGEIREISHDETENLWNIHAGNDLWSMCHNYTLRINNGRLFMSCCNGNNFGIEMIVTECGKCINNCKQVEKCDFYEERV